MIGEVSWELSYSIQSSLVQPAYSQMFCSHMYSTAGLILLTNSENSYVIVYKETSVVTIEPDTLSETEATSSI